MIEHIWSGTSFQFIENKTNNIYYKRDVFIVYTLRATSTGKNPMTDSYLFIVLSLIKFSFTIFFFSKVTTIKSMTSGMLVLKLMLKERQIRTQFFLSPQFYFIFLFIVYIFSSDSQNTLKMK